MNDDTTPVSSPQSSKIVRSLSGLDLAVGTKIKEKLPVLEIEKEKVYFDLIKLASSPFIKMIEGSGYIGGFLDENSGIIWWTLRPNHYQSVLFSKADLTSCSQESLMQKTISEIVKKG